MVSKWLEGGGGASLARAVLKFGGEASLASKKKLLRLTVSAYVHLPPGF